MTYPFIPLGIITIFVGYVAYLLLVKKDLRQFKTVFYPGLFFIGIWVLLYLLIL